MARSQLYITNIGNGPYVRTCTAITDASARDINFLSVIGGTTSIKRFATDLNRSGDNLSIETCGHFRTVSKGYDVYISKDAGSQYSHAIFSRKDRVEKTHSGDEELFATIYLQKSFYYITDILSSTEDMSELYDSLYTKLYNNLSAPLLRDWMPYVFRQLINHGDCRLLRVHNCSDSPLCAIALDVLSSSLYNYLQAGIRESEIFIEPGAMTSETIRNVTGLDSYLAAFRDILARRIQSAFRPEFVPGVDKYDERLETLCGWSEYQGLNPYPAQRDVLQAIKNKLDHDNAVLLKGEMGTGKTLMGAFSSFLANKKNCTNIVLVPSYLKSKWMQEIKQYVPFAEAICIESLEDLQAIEPKVKDKTRRNHLFLIMSNEIAKMSYSERPCAVYGIKTKEHTRFDENLGQYRTSLVFDQHVYRCPVCGQIINRKIETGRGRNKTTEYVPVIDEEFSSKKIGLTDYCHNKIKVWNDKTGVYDERECGAKLWTAYNRDDHAHNWVNLAGKVGWIQRSLISKKIEELSAKDKLNEVESSQLVTLSTKQSELNNDSFVIRAPRLYSIAKYIRRYWTGMVDFFIADEIHNFKAKDSAQGQAFGHLLRSARKSILLTGTLLNGKASSIFYILFRAFPRMMLKAGYSYDDCTRFWTTYGVSKTVTNRRVTSSGSVRDSGDSAKELPGISPLVFTKFLLESAVFLNMRDISDGLPGYTEHPMPVDMSYEMRRHFDEVNGDLRSMLTPFALRRDHDVSGAQVMSQVVNTMLLWPDCPYDNPPIKSKEGTVVYNVPSYHDLIYTKEEEMMRIIDEHIALGEHVLVYYHFTKRTDLGSRLVERIRSHNYQATELQTNTSKSENRSAWIDEQVEKGLQVLVCNPKLVENGLDLLPFTTIIWFQTGYELNTLRQASRRSWRLNQTNDVNVYYLYYKDCPQQDAMSLMATKLQAALAIEGEFSEEGLSAMSNNEDVLTQIASSVVEGISRTVDATIFTKITASQAREANEALRAKAKARHTNSSHLKGLPITVNKKDHDAALSSVEMEILRNFYRGIDTLGLSA